MGIRNFLVEGVSGTGKTSVCAELRRRGYHAINGDTELAYQGDPATGTPTSTGSHWNHLWHEDRVRALVADHGERLSFFCGGSRNVAAFVDLFDGVFVLEVDAATLQERLDRRPRDEFGGRPAERELIVHLHRTGAGLPENGTAVDATAPLTDVVDEILRHAEAIDFQ